MNAILNNDTARPAELLADLIDRHGPWRVMAALAAELLRRGRKMPQAADLSDHLRRDIGLGDLPRRRSDLPPGAGFW